MHKMENFLVCLDNTGLDEQIIRYSAMMANLVDCKKVSFIHATTSKENQGLEKKFNELVAAKFNYDCPTQVEFVKGNNATALLKRKKLSEIDLIVIGAKPGSESTGVHATQVLNGSRCSVLLVPTTAKTDISRVLIPLDFSKNSLRSLQVALAIQKEKSLEILLQHVFYVPTGYSSIGKTYEEFADIMKKNKEREYAQFKHKNNLDDSTYEVIFTLDNDDKPSDNIYEMATEKNVSMIVLGSTGRSKAASFLVKGTAAGLLKYDEDIPCLIVKDKSKRIGFFGALMKV